MEDSSGLAGGVAPQPSSSPPEPARRHWTRPAAVGAVAIAVLAVLAALYLGGHPPFGHSSTATPAGPVTFTAARSSADATLRGYHGGGWSLVGAVGFLSHASLSVPLSGVSSAFSGCPVTTFPGEETLLAPGFHGNASLGVSPMWELLYRNASDGLGIVSVINGTAHMTATIASGSTCATLIGILGTVPSPVADSSTVAANVARAGGTAFLTAHPNANISMSVIGGISYLGLSTGPIWFVAYSLCSVTAPGTGQAAEFHANVSASTGAVLSSHQGTSACTPSAPVALSHSIGPSLTLARSHASSSVAAAAPMAPRRP